MSGLGRLVGPRIKWVVVALAVVLSGLVLAFGGEAEATSTTDAALPASAEAARAAVEQAELPSSGVSPALLVFSRDGGLTDADREAATQAVGRGVQAVEVPETSGGRPSGSGEDALQVSEDGATALAVVPMRADLTDDAVSSQVAALRTAVRDGLPEGLDVAVTGGPAFAADIGAVFDGADIKLLGSTAAVVAILLLITYRSPWLWLVPLSVVGVGDQVAAKAVAVLSRVSDVSADGAVTGIVSVLVFGAGTNYALLIIARYREELRRTEDRHEAMRTALRSAAPAVLASGGTVVLALLALGLLAQDPFASSLGYAAATGIVVALAYALLALPAAMVLFGRRLFWPFVPRAGTDDPGHGGVWRRVGEAVTRRPVVVVTSVVLGLTVLALGSTSLAGQGLQVGQAATEQFLDEPEAVVGQQRLASAFPAGTSEPTVVLTNPQQVEQVTQAAEGVDGVDSVTAGGKTEDRVALSVVLSGSPGSEEALGQVRDLRTAVHQVDGADAIVGGSDAELLDTSTTADRDRTVLFPVILGIVVLVLLLLLRSVVAALVLVTTVVATYVAALGAGWFAFQHLLDFPPLADTTPLLAFLFLVALGVDYNIFLATRAREEAAEGVPAREAVVTALAVTGGVITSAGILLAAVFAVLGVLPLVQLAQIGVIVGFGVLLDTLVVRSLLVPALVRLLGERFWWPGHPHHGRHEAHALAE